MIVLKYEECPGQSTTVNLMDNLDKLKKITEIYQHKMMKIPNQLLFLFLYYLDVCQSKLLI